MLLLQNSSAFSCTRHYGHTKHLLALLVRSRARAMTTMCQMLVLQNVKSLLIKQTHRVKYGIILLTLTKGNTAPSSQSFLLISFGFFTPSDLALVCVWSGESRLPILNVAGWRCKTLKTIPEVGRETASQWKRWRHSGRRQYYFPLSWFKRGKGSGKRAFWS